MERKFERIRTSTNYSSLTPETMPFSQWRRSLAETEQRLFLGVESPLKRCLEEKSARVFFRGAIFFIWFVSTSLNFVGAK